MRVQSPWPDWTNANGGVRSERFYYDGARRIQEMVTDPVATIELLQSPGGAGNNPELSELMNQTVPGEVLGSGDGSANPMSFESGQLENPTNAIGIGGDPLPTSLGGMEREYIWGPGDNGLDEILVQYDIQRKAYWMIQDAGGDVVAMCDLQGSGGTARVVKSWQYDAYGQCLRATDVVTHTTQYSIPINRIGHKGLFMDRLDEGLASSSTHADIPRLVPFSTVLYQNRNRTYSPQLGRFIQRDPNESGQYLSAGSLHGARPSRPSVEFQLDDLYGDTGGLHSYLGSSPLDRRDPRGTFFGGYLGVLITAFMMPLDMLGAVQDVEQHLSMKQHARQALDQMSINMMMDVDWALDLSMSDNFNTRCGIVDEALTIPAPAGSSEGQGPVTAGVSVAMGVAGRSHGGDWHDLKLKQAYSFYVARYGAHNVRFNQAIAKNMGSTFHVAGRVRPDLQIFDSARGKYIIVEVGNTNQIGTGGMGTRRRAIANMLGVPAGDVEFINLNRYSKAMVRGRPPVPRTFRTR